MEEVKSNVKKYKITNKIIPIVKKTGWSSYLLDLQDTIVEFDLDTVVKEEMDGYECIQVLCPIGEAWIPYEALTVVLVDEEGHEIKSKTTGGSFAAKMKKKQQLSRILKGIK